jgi:hypothetical protein
MLHARSGSQRLGHLDASLVVLKQGSRTDLHEQKNGHLGSIYKDVTDFTQIKDHRAVFHPYKLEQRMPKGSIVDITPEFDKRQSFLQTQPNPPPTNDHQKRLQTRAAALGS